MPRYDFYNVETGEIREFVLPMSKVRGEMRRNGVLWRRWHHVPGTVTKTKQYEVKHRGQDLPVSRSLPRDHREGTLVRRGSHVVREHADGTCSTLQGDRIIDSKHARDRHMKLTGAVEADGIPPKK